MDPFTLWTMLLGVGLYSFFHFQTSNFFEEQTTLPPRAINYFERATGLTYGIDADFYEVVVTLIAQSNLSLFLSVATMLLVLFLHPPHPFFTGWRPLSPDRRPASMTLVLIILFLGLLTIRPVTDYFGILEAPVWVWGILGLFLLVWLLGFRLILRQKWFDKLPLPS